MCCPHFALSRPTDTITINTTDSWKSAALQSTPSYPVPMQICRKRFPLIRPHPPNKIIKIAVPSYSQFVTSARHLDWMGIQEPVDYTQYPLTHYRPRELINIQYNIISKPAACPLNAYSAQSVANSGQSTTMSPLSNTHQYPKQSTNIIPHCKSSIPIGWVFLNQ